MIDTIIFDIGNVLAKFCWREYLLELEISEEAKKQISEKIFCGNVWREFDRGRKSDEEIIQECLEVIPDYEDEIRMVFENIEKIAFEYEYAKEWVGELKDQGYKVYILSNYGKNAFERKTYSFLELVDGKVISYEVKSIKPEPEIFQALIGKYDIVPEKSVFFDDMKENVMAARTHGINGIQFFDMEQAKKELASLIG